MRTERDKPTDEPTSSECESCKRTPKWRTDFPIEWEGDHYVSRREMVKFLTLGSVLLAAANWVTAIAGRFRRNPNYPEKLIGTTDQFGENASFLFRYPTEQDPCIAIRTPEGQLVAYSQVCTHLSCAVVYNERDNELMCPCHNGSFNIPQGAPTGGPPTRPLPRIRVEQRGNQVFATGVEIA